MSSSIVEYVSAESNNNKSNEDEAKRFELLLADCNPTASNLSLPADAFLRAAVSLKDQVVEMTWRRRGNNGCLDPTVYTGLMGTAFMCLRSFEATGNRRDLELCSEIADVCASAHIPTRQVTFLCGRGGIYALGAIAANYCGDQKKLGFYLNNFLEMGQETALPFGPEEGGLGMSYDLLYGRAGFLWAAALVNKHLGDQKIPNDLLMPVVEAVLAGGRAGASDNPTSRPLMYRCHGTRYWGASHGLAGILHVLLHFHLSSDDMEDVKATLRYMMRNRFPHSGNYPVSEGNPRDKLVQWSHGAGGIALTLCEASRVFASDREFRDGAIEAGEVVWKNGLMNKVVLADGTAGNVYVFLSLFRLTGDGVYRERAEAFASYLYHGVRKMMGQDSDMHIHNEYSLLEGLAGVACLWFDLLRPHESRFPGFEI